MPKEIPKDSTKESLPKGLIRLRSADQQLFRIIMRAAKSQLGYLEKQINVAVHGQRKRRKRRKKKLKTVTK